jgi:hypothetical protein
MSLEEFQMETLGRSVFVVGLRFKNIFAFSRGTVDPFGLASRLPTEDPWAYQKITSWNFLPFQLQHAGQAPSWVVQLVFALWGAALIGLLWTLMRLRKVIASEKLTPTDLQ